ncbi:hypothetical protein LQD23_16225 [Chromobacterium violaceum]|uniref:hypothetical protein n=1 Tax=Chromobacterium violaceum TaxID=536 RepID=UPI001E353C54|nr:hypothetical protein [Chromobacterium violaceum]MCD0493828.1 hypothetical protein [Chromobacterium violaceum]
MIDIDAIIDSMGWSLDTNERKDMFRLCQATLKTATERSGEAGMQPAKPEDQAIYESIAANYHQQPAPVVPVYDWEAAHFKMAERVTELEVENNKLRQGIEALQIVQPQPAPAVPDGVRAVWDVFSGKEWFMTVTSPLDWDAKAVSDSLTAQRFAPHLNVVARHVAYEGNPIAALTAELERMRALLTAAPQPAQRPAPAEPACHIAEVSDEEVAIACTPAQRLLLREGMQLYAAPQPAQQLSSVIEEIAQQWDGCIYDSPSGDIDIGWAIRAAGKRLVSEQPKEGGE